MDIYVKSVARTYHWPPSEIDKLFADEIDMYGLVYWYKDALDQERELKQ